MSRTTPPHYDGHGNVYCHQCRRYRPADDFRWVEYPSQPRGHYWSYCKPCTRELDRLRWTGARRARQNGSRTERQRRQRRRERQERTRFVRDGILLLRRRGLTKAEICRLTGLSLNSLLTWERGACPTPAVEARVAILLRETSDLPLVPEPAFRRRLPHPAMDRLMARCRPEMDQYPVRSRWGTRATPERVG